MAVLQNKVAKKPIELINLDSFFAKPANYVFFDLSTYLFKGLLLKEKEFRAAIKNHNFTVYNGQFVGLGCSTNAIIPSWAYMLVAAQLVPNTKAVFYVENESELAEKIAIYNIEQTNFTEYNNKRVVVKGCSNHTTTNAIYVAITKKLHGVVKACSFGELCSMVPVFK